MKALDLEELMRIARDKYGDIPILIRVGETPYDIDDISVFEIEGFNYIVIGVEKLENI